MSRRTFPLYLDQQGVDELAQLLYVHQHVIDVVSERPAPDKAFRALTELRRQCCVRSGAADPFPDLPFVPGIFEGKPKRRRRA